MTKETDEAKDEAEKKAAAAAKKKAAAAAKKKAVKSPKDLLTVAKYIDANVDGDLMALIERLKKNQKAKFSDKPPVHSVQIYGIKATGASGFRLALKNWSNAARRIAKQG